MKLTENFNAKKSLTEVKQELSSFHNNVDKLSNIANIVSLASIGSGAIAALAFGPIAFATGAVIGFAVVQSLKLYTQSKKKYITTEVEDLEHKNTISHNEASYLKNQLGKIYSDKLISASVES